MPADPNQQSYSGQHHIGLDHELPAPAPHRSRFVRVVVWVLLLLAFAAAFYFVVNRKEAPKEAGPGGGRRGGPGSAVSINTVTAQRGDIGVYLDAIGTVTPVFTASITSQANGLITAVHYKEGQLVRKGQPLIDIDDRSYRATLLQAQGTLDRDQGILAQARMDLERYQAAWARQAIAKQQLDDQEKVVLQDEGTVKNDQGLVAYDEVQVSYCHILSPITGRVGLRLVDPGNVVSANGTTVLVVVTQIQPITVVFTIPEDSLNQVQDRLRHGARLPVDAYDRTSVTKIDAGTLITLDNQVDTTTGTVKGRASFVNRNSSLFPNQFVNTKLLVNTLQQATLVPSSTIQHNGSTAFVYTVENDTAHQQSVKTLVTSGTMSAVQGIKPGDVLADSSFDKLQDKVKVAVSKRPVGTSPAGSDAP